MRAIGVVIGAIIAGLCVSGCSAGESSPPPVTSATASSSQPVPAGLAPPRQAPEINGPLIEFDPCTNINKALLVSVGLAGAKIQRSDRMGSPTSSLGCIFTGGDKLISVFSGNEAFVDQLDRDRALRTGPPAQLITINGREAFTGPNRIGDQNCTVVMRTDFGHVYVDGGYIVNRAEFQRRQLNTCAEILRIATLLEPLLPKGH
ncbi:DUF3558 domain-containing protein [Skermania sp. ID1734]|uniref:DUF3558 domain-containing protein n=1 Tax=Skermania sp. ID1734 TaxID=2597516 RepID=UPI00117F018B|nr:DUF3558 domain-containing protein [Skermania sp. ID1734]TSE01869.1 DUF3558 domain-containing protein [Skermania sp. ID1734]